MKNSWFTGALAGVLVVAAFAAALLVARVFLTTRQLRSLQPMLVEVNNRLNFAQALLNETLEYSKRNPAIDPLLVSLNFKTGRLKSCPVDNFRPVAMKTAVSTCPCRSSNNGLE